VTLIIFPVLKEAMMYDEIDKELILALRNNGRESYRNLSHTLAVAEGTVRQRLSRLFKEDMVKVAVIPNLHKFGYGFVGIMGMQVKMGELEKVAKKLAESSHVCYLTWVTGRYDLMAIVLCQSPRDFAQFVQKEISSTDSILRTETFVNLDIIKGVAGQMDTIQLIHDLKPSRSLKKRQIG
jgi:Lrp/AsnC family transcriptional regulator for asnA, asnC and gidA